MRYRFTTALCHPPRYRRSMQLGTMAFCPITPLSFTGAPSYSKTNGIVVNASLRSGQSYQIQANTNLASTNWIALTNFTAGTRADFLFYQQTANEYSTTILSNCDAVNEASGLHIPVMSSSMSSPTRWVANA